MLLYVLLLDVRRVLHGDSSGRLKDPSPKWAMRHGMFSLPVVVLLFASLLSRSGKTLCARAPIYCPCRLSSACLNPQPFSLMGSLIRSSAKSLQSFMFIPAHVLNKDIISSSIPFAKSDVKSGRICLIQ